MKKNSLVKSAKTAKPSKAIKKTTDVPTTTVLTNDTVTLVLGATLAFPDGSGLAYQDPVFNQSEKTLTKEQVLKSFRKSVAFVETMIEKQWEQRAK
jgi:hypothetical protein